jgi:magnesium transporter
MKKRIKVPVPPIPKISFRRFSEKGKANETVGQAPGTLIYTGKKTQEKVHVELYSYDLNEIEIAADENFEQIKRNYKQGRVNWINVSGLHNVKLIEQIGIHFKLHPLLLEDVVHVDQRPKTEDFGEYLFFTIKVFHKKSTQETDFEHISFVLGEDFIICFQENPEDNFDLIRNRLKNSFGKIREKRADYLFYRFIDTIIDHYFIILDGIAERIELLEDEVMERPNNSTLQKLQLVRKELIYLRRSIYPLRESINSILKSETKLLNQETERFFTDVYDHTIQVIESMETYRELLSGIMDLYMNTASNRMNEIMKVLTIMSTIFIPLTFIAGIYGMNFEHMPELKHQWAYPLALGLMVLIALFMLVYFKRKKWL